DRRGLLVNVTRPGIGGTVLLLQRTSPDLSVTTRLEPRRGYRTASTVLIDVTPRQGPLLATVHLYDPDKRSTVQIGKTAYPLDADYSVTFAAYSRVNELWIGFYNMIRGQNMREQAGLVALQPYDPNKVPVILVHGLLSSAYAWRNVANSLQADPEIRKHYQFWVFSYSTGSFIGYNAELLRQDMQYAEAKYHLDRTVLIGHSMGGILSRAQATNSDMVFWDKAFGDKADSLYKTIPADSVVKRALIFKADPTIHRIIFIATPHRGSSIATGGIGKLGISLIQVPLKLVSLIPKSAIEALAPNGDASKYRLPTSINSLSPKNKFLLALADLPIQAPFDSIIGDQGKGNTPNSSDSVVPYSSSHVNGAKSETILPGNHGTVVNMSIPVLDRLLRQEAGLKPQSTR
ncbi:MAG: alpha/beta fold hydrolase, partial [Verrucomicrobia bacterium]|nr:alpha/beta fold hydrolase [Verrucomicrobiota bacterium]